MGIGDNIRKIREAHGLTQEEFGKIASVSSMAVSQWENSRSVPRMSAIQAIADYFHISKGEILDGSTFPTNTIPARPSTATAPLLGWVHAGSSEDERALDGSVELPGAVLAGHPKGFFLRVEGDCMNRQFPEGCYVFVDPDVVPWNGCAVAAELPGYKGVLRSYYRGQSSLMLCADSFGEYEDIILTGDDPVRLIGVVVWFQADRELER